MNKITASASTVLGRAGGEGVGVRLMATYEGETFEFGRLLRRGDEDDRSHTGYDVEALQVEPGVLDVRPTTLLGELFVSLLAAGG